MAARCPCGAEAAQRIDSVLSVGNPRMAVTAYQCERCQRAPQLPPRRKAMARRGYFWSGCWVRITEAGSGEADQLDAIEAAQPWNRPPARKAPGSDAGN